MKNRITIIAFIIHGFIFAQSPILPLDAPINQITHNAYLKDTYNQLPPFEGTWGYTAGTTKVTIQFKKIMHYSSGYGISYYLDKLVANYKIEKNGQVIFNNLGQAFSMKSPIWGTFFDNGKYNVTYIDELKCDMWGDTMIWINGQGKLQWEMRMAGGVTSPYVDCPQESSPGFFDAMTLPYIMTMTKQ